MLKIKVFVPKKIWEAYNNYPSTAVINASGIEQTLATEILDIVADPHNGSPFSEKCAEIYTEKVKYAEADINKVTTKGIEFSLLMNAPDITRGETRMLQQAVKDAVAKMGIQVVSPGMSVR